MCNVLPSHKKLSVLHHLVEGNSIRSTERLTGVHRDTIMRLSVRMAGLTGTLWSVDDLIRRIK